MGLVELVILALGLSMDAFAVSVCKGLAFERVTPRGVATVGLWFGGFQALMPLLGYLLGARFSEHIQAYDHYIAFGMLLIIGANMIREARACKEEVTDDSLSVKSMLPLAVATSIDALAVGVTFGVMNVNIGAGVALIGAITCALSAIGVKTGNLVGNRFKNAAELVGGVVLILLGTEILLDHLGVL